MQSDDELCLCFHVSKHKITKFLAIEKPQRVSQLANCFGAGTGCGWCRPYLERLFETAQKSKFLAEDDNKMCELPSADEYGQQRKAYLESRKGQNSPIK